MSLLGLSVYQRAGGPDGTCGILSKVKGRNYSQHRNEGNSLTLWKLFTKFSLFWWIEAIKNGFLCSIA